MTSCLSAETIFRAVTGEAPRASARRLAEHAATCEACATAWRIADAYCAEAGIPRVVAARGVPTAPRFAALAAAVLLAALVAPLAVRELAGPSPSPMRSNLAAPLSVAEGEGRVVPVDGAVLRWMPAAPGARYTVRVTDAALRIVAVGRGLSDAQYRIPPEALAGTAPGTTLLWQVEATLPDGSQLASQTHTVRIAAPGAR